jgi:asparagine synthase (glutamine-hydrolysing)
MCGIWLLFTKDSKLELTSYELYKSFMRFKPRGPENSDFKVFDQYSTIIGFHRLAINGLVKSSANQPFMYDTCEKVVYVMCNGEIYNYKELAEKYQIELQTGSDCEIIYPLYQKVGADELTKELDGEFAIIICEIDKITKEVKMIVARDQCGIRPLFMAYSEDTICFSSEMKGLPYLTHDNFKIQQFPPRCYSEITSKDVFSDIQFKEYFSITNIQPIIFDREQALKVIREEFIDSVMSRMMCDREFACLLSGGLDSSLVSAVASRICQSRGKVLKTFCIGMDENSPDIIWAKKVAEHIKSDHTTIIIPEEEWLEAIQHIVDTIESYDITTVRASTGQYLVAKWIAKNRPEIKVLLIGDGSDELTGGYIYTLKAPSHEEFHQEILKLLNDIHYFDVLRSDRGIASNGLEARVPFLRKQFIEKYLSIDVKIRMPNNNIEKSLLRDSFKNTDYLPLDVIERSKEAFSDGVSTMKRSWFSILRENIDKMYTQEEFLEKSEKYLRNKPPTKEALYYRETFVKFFGPREEVAKIIPRFWLPNWSENIKEPSARVLKHYKESS